MFYLTNDTNKLINYNTKNNKAEYDAKKLISEINKMKFHYKNERQIFIDKILLEFLTEESISIDMFTKYDKNTMNEIFNEIEEILNNALDENDNIMEDNELYNFKKINKICLLLKDSKSKKMNNLPISALFF